MRARYQPLPLALQGTGVSTAFRSPGLAHRRSSCSRSMVMAHSGVESAARRHRLLPQPSNSGGAG